MDLTDSYKSLSEALMPCRNSNSAPKSILHYIDAEEIRAKGYDTFRKCGCYFSAGWFWGGAVEGKILAAQYARENNVPYLGICLGMQIAIIEFARHKAECLKTPTAQSLIQERLIP